MNRALNLKHGIAIDVMDWIIAAAFLIVCELASLPLRAMLAGAPAPPDVKRALSRIAGPAVIVLPLWFAAHIAPWILSNGAGRAWLTAWLALGAGVVVRHRYRPAQWLAYRSPRLDRAQRFGGAGLDVVTLALFFGFVALRRWAPEMIPPSLDLSSGAEKFANQTIFWSCWSGRSIPPMDYWLAGRPLTYYYWGHFHWAWLGRIGALPAEAALTLALARAVTMVWESCYLLARALRLRPAASALAALAAAWGGNPAALEALRRVWDGGLRFRLASYPYWDPSRAIEHVVDEFPAFSAILGDFHAHHLALPWWTAMAALIVAGARWSGWRGEMAASRRLSVLTGWALLTAALAASSVMANLWNLPLVMTALALATIVGMINARRGGGVSPGAAGAAALFAVLACVVTVLFSAILIRNGAQLPLPAHEYPNVFQTPPLASFTNALPDSLRERLAAAPLYFLPAPLRTPPIQWLMLWGWPMALITVSLAASIRIGRARRNAPMRRAWIVAAFALAVIGGLEIVYVADRFEGELARYNSYFKFSYPVWPLLWIAAWSLLWRERRGRRAIRLMCRALCVSILALAMLYPLCAWPARIAQAMDSDSLPRRPTLNSVDYAERHPFCAVEAPMLRWIRANVPPGEIVLTAPSDGGYDYCGRIAALAGRPIAMGWYHHETQWRGFPFEGCERHTAIDACYLSGEGVPETMTRECGIAPRWAVYGVTERERYGEAALAALMAHYPVAASFPEDKPEVYVFDLCAGKD